MDKIKLSVAEKLKEYRKLNKLSQLQLAEKLDRSVKTVQQWEQANTGVPVEILLLLRDELKISIDEIFGLQPINKPLTNEDLINDFINDRGIVFRNCDNYCWDMSTKDIVSIMDFEMRNFLNLIDPYDIKLYYENGDVLYTVDKDFRDMYIFEFLLRKNLINYYYPSSDDGQTTTFCLSKELSKLMLDNFIVNVTDAIQFYLSFKDKTDDIAKHMFDELEKAKSMLKMLKGE